MSDRVSTGRLTDCAGLLTTAAAAAIFVSMTGFARADTPEYWNRETFHTERPIITARLSSEEDEDAAPARRHTRRAAVAASRSTDDDEEGEPVRRRAPRAVSSDEDKPAPRRHARTPSRQKHVRVASLGNTYAPPSKPQRSVAEGGSIRWLASAGCLNGTLRGVLSQVAARFGSVTVNSTCRSRGHNARVGGAPRSKHLSGDAADFRIHGNWGAASSFIRGMVGGFKHYGGGLFHIDTGPKRTW